MPVKDKVEELQKKFDKEDDDEFQVSEDEAVTPASAKNIPRPATVLPAGSAKKVGKMTVSLLGQTTSPYLSLEEIEKLNQTAGADARTPLLTIIIALVNKAGGRTTVEEIAAEAGKYWNRSFPAGPYTPEEFIYMMARNSDYLRVS
jgi:hypothetical protein